MFGALAIGTGLGIVFSTNQGAIAESEERFLEQENTFFLLQENGSNIIIT